MDTNLIEPALTLWAFLLQAILFPTYIPASYIAYRWVRAPLKRERVRHSLAQLGLAESEEWMNNPVSEYYLKHYVWPLCLATGFTFITYAAVHPYIIQTGAMAGFSEEIIDVFGPNNKFTRTILHAHTGLWGFMGAYIYSFHLLWRRYLTYDLTPSVYVFIFNRFALASVVGTVVGMGVGTFATAAGLVFEVNIITVSLVAFFIGFFPDQGITWLAVTVKKTLRLQGPVAKETHLAEIEGLGIWHQGRLQQEGIENVQNLAMANVAALVVRTPFTVNQIIDWVDQAILLAYTCQRQFDALEAAGLLRASDVLVALGDNKGLEELTEVTNLKKSELKVLARVLQSALNIRLVLRFRQRSRLEKLEDIPESPVPHPSGLALAGAGI